MITREQLKRVQRADGAGVVRVDRRDRFELRLDASTVVRHANGWVDVWGVATRVGVFDYDDEDRPGEILREWRPPEEVLKSESLDTLVGVPFTIDHPDDPVTSANFRDLAQGHVLGIKVKGDLVLARIRIATDDAIAEIKSGTIELSCGYSARLDETPGITPEGDPYDATQRDIRYNHLALVDYARAGHVARLHLDGKGARVQRRDQARRSGSTLMYKLKLDGKTHIVPALLVAGLSALATATAKGVRRGDAIETAAATFETPDGTVELVLPVASVEEMLSMIGATESPEPAAPVDADPDPPEPDADPLEQPEDADPDPDAEDPDRKDKAISKIVDAAIAKAIPKALKAREDRARVRAELERSCVGHLESGYRFDKASDLDLMLDTIEAVAPSRSDKAKSLAASAAKGDERARGRLDGMLDDVLSDDRDDRDDTGAQAANVFEMRRADSAKGEPTATAGQTRADAIRAERNARRANGKPKAAG